MKPDIYKTLLGEKYGLKHGDFMSFPKGGMILDSPEAVLKHNFLCNYFGHICSVLLHVQWMQCNVVYRKNV